MCGFAGVIKRTAAQFDFPIQRVIKQMGQNIAHRGPDDEQYYSDSYFNIVFRRLSIIDTENGSQPITNEDGNLILAINGEIYNHKHLKHLLKDSHTFKSKSDCEVVIHLYEEMGIDCLTHLNGMFSLVLWDKKHKSLIIAKDRLGIKPLYYNVTNSRIIFGSEIKSLFPFPDCPRELDWHTALSHTLHHVNPSYELSSFFNGIHNLRGGEVLQYFYDDNKITLHPYWELLPLNRDLFFSDARNVSEIIQGYKHLLEDSVDLQLMCDADIGLFLSGGIDSVVLAYLSSKKIRIPTYSVLSQSTFSTGDVKSAIHAANSLELPNHQVLFNWHGQMYNGNYWKNLLWHLETPLCSAEHLYKYELHRYAKNLNPNIKVILSGQGSDEFNGGYCEQYISNDHRYKPNENNWELFMQSIDSVEKTNLFQGKNAGLAGYANLLNKDFLSDHIGVATMTNPWNYHANMYSYSLQMYNLWHEDRTAAANGIENRVPFLDHRIVEYTMRIPPKFRKELFWNKQILRKAFEANLPSELIQRPKVPFFYGKDVRYTYRMLYDLLMNNQRELIYESLGDPSSTHAIFDRKLLEENINLIASDAEFSQIPQLLTLVNMGLLENMAATNGLLNHNNLNSAVSERVIVNNYVDDEASLALKLGIRRNSITLDSIIKLAENVKILSNKHQYYIAVDDRLEYLIDDEDSEWITFLNTIDGKLTLESVLSLLHMNESKIRVHLEQAFDYHLLECVTY